MIPTIRHITFLLFLTLWMHSNASANLPPNNFEFQAAAETDILQQTPSEISDFSYFQLEFRNFPLSILWQLKKVAPAIEKELPANLKVGLESSEDGGNLIFSYHKEGELVFLTMSLIDAVASNEMVTFIDSKTALLDMSKSIHEPSSDKVAETVVGFFKRFCEAWEKNQQSSSLNRNLST